jgi:hypothetical protein
MLENGSATRIVSVQTSVLIGLKPASQLQHELLADVRFGSEADIPRCPGHVRYTPKS